MKKVYLACPYSSADSEKKEIRAALASRAASLLILQNYLVFSPITHGHALDKASPDLAIPSDWNFWKAHCCSLLTEWADALFILCLSGWKKSKGVQAELVLARELGMEIKFLSFALGELVLHVSEPSFNFEEEEEYPSNLLLF